MNVLVAFSIVIIILLVALIKFKVNPSIGIFLAAILMGLFTSIPIKDLLSLLTEGFGKTMSSIGLVIIFGGIFGQLLAASGGTEEMAKWLLKTVGKKNDLLALNLAGFIVSIPVYFASGFIMLSPIVNSLQEITKKRKGAYIATLFTGLLLTHCIVAPTPGPVAVSALVGANLGWFILYGIIVAVPASLIAGWQFGNFMDKSQKKEMKEMAQNLISNDSLLEPDKTKPSAQLSLILILFPIILIILGSVIPMFFNSESLFTKTFIFLGNNNIALFIAMIVTAIVLHKYLIPRVDNSIMSYIEKSGDKLGSIIMVIGTGGCFGQILQTSGVGDALVSLLEKGNIPIVFMAFLLAMAIRGAVGSATVAMLTTASIVGPAAISLGYSPIIIGLAICSGTAGLTLPTDAAFWLPIKYCDIDIKEAFKVTTIPTTLASFIAFLVILLLNAFVNILPGMY